MTEVEYGAAKAWLFSTAYRVMIDIIREREEADPDRFIQRFRPFG